MTTTHSILAVLLAMSINLVAGANSYTEADISRIEYQIPMARDELAGADNTEVEGTIDEFIDWIEDLGVEATSPFFSTFALIVDETKKKYRRKDELTFAKAALKASNDVPRSSSIKYRRSLYEELGFRYQKDLSWEITLSTPGQDADWPSIAVQPDYDSIYGEKVEANVFAETCDAVAGGDASLRAYEDEPVGFTGKLEFDDDELYDDVELDTSSWVSGVSIETICQEMEDYFVDFCEYYKRDNGSFPNMDSNLRTNYQYVVDVDFTIQPTGAVAECEGKFTWQVRYNTENAIANGNPSPHSTELSLKLKKSKCDKAEEGIIWTDNVALANEIVDHISDNAPWILREGCSA